MKVREQIIGFGRYDLEGSLVDVIAKLVHAEAQHSTTYEDLRIDIELRQRYGEDEIVVELYGDREETAAEKKSREREEHAKKRVSEHQERQVLKILKAKYEK